MPEAPPRGTLLCFDYGRRRIGVAVGQTLTRTAGALETVANGEAPDWAALDRLVDRWRPKAFVVGLPLNPDGEETQMCGTVRRFGAELEQRFERPVHFYDERLSSRAAEAQFAEARAGGAARRKHVLRLDALAAQIILENWLQSHPGDTEA